MLRRDLANATDCVSLNSSIVQLVTESVVVYFHQSALLILATVLFPRYIHRQETVVFSGVSRQGYQSGARQLPFGGNEASVPCLQQEVNPSSPEIFFGPRPPLIHSVKWVGEIPKKEKDVQSGSNLHFDAFATHPWKGRKRVSRSCYITMIPSPLRRRT